jgi:hypothetical protein
MGILAVDFTPLKHVAHHGDHMTGNVNRIAISPPSLAHRTTERGWHVHQV